MADWACRACGGDTGALVLDLGEQPACDYFPRADDPGPDPEYPLQMWLCAPLRPGPARGRPDRAGGAARRPSQPRWSRRQPTPSAGWRRLACSRTGGTVAEYGSPHGGSWLGLLADRGLKPAADGEPADVVVDCFGLMHDRRPGRGHGRARGADRAGWRPAAAVPLLRGDRRARPMERAAARALRLLLDHRADPACWRRIGFSPVTRVARSSSTAGQCCWRPAGTDVRWPERRVRTRRRRDHLARPRGTVSA